MGRLKIPRTAGRSYLEWSENNKSLLHVKIFDLYGAPGRIRTCGTWIRNPMLYPLSYGGFLEPSKPQLRLNYNDEHIKRLLDE